MKNNELISEFKRRYELKADKDVAFVLLQSSANLHSWLTDRRPIPLGIKLRLLDLINFDPAVARIATALLDGEDHNGNVAQDLARIDEIRSTRGTTERTATNLKQANQIMELERREGLSDRQMAKHLFSSEKQIQAVKTGKGELSKTALFNLIIQLGYAKTRDALIDLRSISEAAKAELKRKDNHTIQNNLERLIERDNAKNSNS